MQDVELKMDVNASAFEALLRSIYTKPDIACVRELIRNGIDAHIEAGNDAKVDVSLSERFFYLRDYGNGISPEDLENMMSVVMRSTKRSDDNTQTGSHGLGSKTVFGILYNDLKTEQPLSTAIMESFHNGIRYVYNLTICNGMPKYQLVYKEASDEPSGVKYIIEKRGDRMVLSTHQFLVIFSPIMDKINFIDTDVPILHTIQHGKYKLIAVLREIDHEDDLYNRRSRSQTFTVSSFSNSNRHFLQYYDMLYPFPIDDELYGSDDAITRDIREYAIRELNRTVDHNLYEANINDFIIAYDIGRESFGLEPTQSRDGLIFSGFDRDIFVEDMNLGGRFSDDHYISGVVYSTFKKVKEFIDDGYYVSNPFTERLLNNFHEIDAVTSTILDVITSKNFSEINNSVIPNLSRHLGICFEERNFSLEEVVYVIQSVDVRLRSEEAYEELLKTICHSNGRYPRNVALHVASDTAPWPVARTTTLINYNFSHALSVSEGLRSIANGQMAVERVVRYSDGEFIEDGVIEDVRDSDSLDDYIFILKNKRLINSKFKQYVKNNEGKTVVVYDDNPTHLSNSRIINLDAIPKAPIKVLHLLTSYFGKHGIKTVESELDAIKATKNKKEPKAIKVANLNSNVRQVSIVADGKDKDVATYQDVIDVVENNDKVYLLRGNGDIEISRNFYGEMKSTYRFSFWGGFIRINVLSSTTYNGSLDVRTFYNSIDVPNDDAIIIVGDDASKAITDYLDKQTNIVDYVGKSEEIVDRVEERLFGSEVHHSDKQDIIDYYVLRYMTIQLFGLVRRTNNPPRGFGSPRTSSLSHQLCERYITKASMVELPPETLSKIHLMFDKEDCLDILNRLNKYINFVDVLLEKYSKEEREFIACINNTLSGNIQQDKRTIQQMEKLHTL